MAFPSPSLAPPALAAYQMSFGGLAFGGIAAGSAYQLQSLPSTSMPDVSSADVARALEQGEFAGVDTLPGRDLTIVQVVTGGFAPTGAPLSSAQAIVVDQAVRALGGVLGVAGATEAPFYWQLPSGLFACMARPRKHLCPFDVSRVLAGAVVATSLLHCTDPRWYGAPSKSASVGLPAPLGGLTFPATFPLSFGGGGVGGLLSVQNSGLFEMRPVLLITGPCANPVISNLSIAGAPQIGVSISLNAGDTLQIDTDFQTVTYTAAGTVQGVSRRNALIAGSTWWNLPPGPSTIEFTTSDGSQVAGTLTVQSADAWLSI